MVKLGGFNLDNLKKMGSDLMSSVTKPGVSKEDLPEEIKTKVEEIGKYTADLAEAHKKVDEIAMSLQKAIMEFYRDVIALYKPEEPKAATPKAEAKPAEPKAEEKPAEESKEEKK